MSRRRAGYVVKRTLEAAIVVALALTMWRAAAWYFKPKDGGWSLMGPLVRVGGYYSPGRSAGSSRRVVLIAQSTCPGCNRDLAFYKRIGERAQGEELEFVIVVQEPRAVVRKWLTDAGVSFSRIHRVNSLQQHGFVFTPTLMITEADGSVTDLVGATTTPDIIARFLARLVNRDTDPLNLDILAKEVPRDLFAPPRRVQRLDVRSRASYDRPLTPDTKHIPMEELSIRALAELNMAAPVAIDCASENAARCRAAGSELVQMGFADVTVLTPLMTTLQSGT